MYIGLISYKRSPEVKYDTAVIHMHMSHSIYRTDHASSITTQVSSCILSRLQYTPLYTTYSIGLPLFSTVTLPHSVSIDGYVHAARSVDNLKHGNREEGHAEMYSTEGEELIKLYIDHINISTKDHKAYILLRCYKRTSLCLRQYSVERQRSGCLYVITRLDTFLGAPSPLPDPRPFDPISPTGKL